MTTNTQGTQISNPPKIVYYVKEFLFWFALIVVFIFSIFPLYWMFNTSFKPRADVEMMPPTFIPFVDYQPTLNNYVDVFLKDRAGAGFAEVDQ